jgi:hypothetical protein
VIDDYFASEFGIVNRLLVEVPEVNGHVFTPNDISQVTSEQQITPAIHVIYGGSILGKCSSDGQSQVFEQIWIIVLAVKNAQAQKTGEKLRAEAGPIICKILRALQGFVPADGFESLHRFEASEPIYLAGFACYPLGFTTKLTI